MENILVNVSGVTYMIPL